VVVALVEVRFVKTAVLELERIEENQPVVEVAR
jgi:hypothetical protein